MSDILCQIFSNKIKVLWDGCYYNRNAITQKVLFRNKCSFLSYPKRSHSIELRKGEDLSSANDIIVITKAKLRDIFGQDLMLPILEKFRNTISRKMTNGESKPITSSDGHPDSRIPL